jgi:SAM-dependent methyltransferase
LVIDWISRSYPNRHDLQVLDVGCGTGLMMQELALLGDVRGVDLSDQAVDYCRQRGIMGAQLGDVCRLEFPDESFDVVCAVDILEHIEDDHRALTEWKRVLKPDGRIFVFVPAHSWLWSLQDEISGHYRRYTRARLDGVVTSAGLVMERRSYVSTLLFPVIFFGRQWLRILRRFKDVKTENTLHPHWSNGLLRSIFSLEILILRRTNLPFGASLVCIATKATSSRSS